MSNEMTYIVKAGSTWARIAFELWGEETLMWKLIEANPLRCDTIVFEGGEVLKVPELKETDLKAAMPPWRK